MVVVAPVVVVVATVVVVVATVVVVVATVVVVVATVGIVKFFGAEVTVPLGVMTEIGPVVAPSGTVAWIRVALSTVGVVAAEVPLN